MDTNCFQAGLNTVNLSQITTFQQALLLILLLMGSSIFVSIFTVLTRKRVFENRFKDVVKLQKEMRRERRASMSNSRRASTSNLTDSARPASAVKQLNEERPGLSLNTEHSESNLTAPEQKKDALPISQNVTFAVPGPFRSPYPGGVHRRNVYTKPEETGGQEDLPGLSHYPHYLTPNTTGRNARFFGLSKEERKHLGGVEYRAIELLAWVVPAYFILWQLLGCLGLGAYSKFSLFDLSTL
jgi:hypothetical protein